MASDANWANRLLLLQENGNKTDERGAAWVNVGTPIYRAGYFASTNGLAPLDTGSGYLQQTPATIAAIGTGIFAIEALFKVDGAASDGVILGNNKLDGSTPNAFSFRLNSSGQLTLDMPGLSISSPGAGLDTGNWYFVQGIRDGSGIVTLRVAQMGLDSSTAVVATSATTANNISDAGSIFAGALYNGTLKFPGVTMMLRVTKGIVPTFVIPAGLWPGDPAGNAVLTGRSATWTRGTAVGRGAGKGFTSGRSATYGLGTPVATGRASAAPGGQNSTYSRGNAAASGLAAAGATGQFGTYALGTPAAGVTGLATASGVSAGWTQGIATADPGSQAGVASPLGIAGTYGAGAGQATGAGRGAGLGVGATYLLGLSSASAGAVAVPVGISSTWGLGQVDAEGARVGIASPAGLAAAWLAADVIARAGASAVLDGVAGAWSVGGAAATVAARVELNGTEAIYALGQVEAHSARSPSQWVFWIEPGESRTMAINHENRTAVIAGESREYRLIP